MAEYLSTAFMGRKFSIGACSLLLVAAVAGAQSLPDPTQPPASGAPVRDLDSAGKANPTPILQSIIISPTRRLAIIAGHTLKQGDKYGDAKLVKITETEVVLRGSNGIQTLKLFPNIEKQPLSRQLDNKIESRGNKGKS